MTGGTPAEKTYVERWMDWLLASLNTPYVAVFKDAKKPAAERERRFRGAKRRSGRSAEDPRRSLAGKSWFALNRLTLADIALAPIVQALPRISDREAGICRAQRWQKAIDARPAFAVATGAKPSALTTAA